MRGAALVRLFASGSKVLYDVFMCDFPRYARKNRTPLIRKEPL
jgi:hypothetical protein